MRFSQVLSYIEKLIEIEIFERVVILDRSADYLLNKLFQNQIELSSFKFAHSFLVAKLAPGRQRGWVFSGRLITIFADWLRVLRLRANLIVVKTFRIFCLIEVDLAERSLTKYLQMGSILTSIVCKNRDFTLLACKETD